MDTGDLSCKETHDSAEVHGNADACSFSPVSQFAPITPEKIVASSTSAKVSCAEREVNDDLSTVSEHVFDDKEDQSMKLDRKPRRNSKRKKHRPKVVADNKAVGRKNVVYGASTHVKVEKKNANKRSKVTKDATGENNIFMVNKNATTKATGFPRRYVRRKKNESTIGKYEGKDATPYSNQSILVDNTTSVEENIGTTTPIKDVLEAPSEVKTIAPTRKARRRLNFGCEEVRHENCCSSMASHSVNGAEIGDSMATANSEKILESDFIDLDLKLNNSVKVTGCQPVTLDDGEFRQNYGCASQHLNARIEEFHKNAQRAIGDDLQTKRSFAYDLNFTPKKFMQVNEISVELDFSSVSCSSNTFGSILKCQDPYSGMPFFSSDVVEPSIISSHLIQDKLNSRPPTPVLPGIGQNVKRKDGSYTVKNSVEYWNFEFVPPSCKKKRTIRSSTGSVSGSFSLFTSDSQVPTLPTIRRELIRDEERMVSFKAPEESKISHIWNFPLTEKFAQQEFSLDGILVLNDTHKSMAHASEELPLRELIESGFNEKKKMKKIASLLRGSLPIGNASDGQIASKQPPFVNSKELTLYSRETAIIHFEQSIKSLRPKVLLDDETNRVWKLLLQSIDNEGIDGGDEEKVKWWKKERDVFRGRANAFIGRMRLVQGDRRFSCWKGSVVDSVVGVFLTQNVADHLSSSAFMSLASRFPAKLNGSEENHEEYKVNNADDALGYVEDLERSNEILNELEANCKTSCSYVVEERETTNNDMLLDRMYSNDVFNSTLNDSFHDVSDGAKELNTKTELRKEDHIELRSCQTTTFNSATEELSCKQFHYNAISSTVAEFDNLENYDTINRETCMSKTWEFQSCGSIETDGALTIQVEQANKETKTGNALKSSGLDIKLSYSVEAEEKLLRNNRDVNLCSFIDSSSTLAPVNDATLELSGVLKSTEEASACNILPSDSPKLNNISLLGNDDAKINEAKRKAKSRRVGNEIKENFDWDALRKEAEANMGKSNRSALTMDALDWEAVRCADIEDIADAIKERGMNNMLAKRIKDFLDRLINEFGSIDLEWLRNIHQDKAKEYMLTIKGLGLKSVECVRLLTLHQLAFPVDTNVGRIAVRLGWVPLQPLPESLQLHLLELYPVLESIQRYLWPRLCKLDQKTLYELHYQMITFGKVFCTKTKPNCNACPMRGECRHFASAFASTRFALPGTEHTGSASETENVAPSQIDFLVDKISMDLKTILSQDEQPFNCQPFVEEPSSPELECNEIENVGEDPLSEDTDEIPVIKLNIKELANNLHEHVQNKVKLEESDMSKAIVVLTEEAASIPMPKLKNVARLRTEHQVYELPDSHPLIQLLEEREPDDPCPYLFAIWALEETSKTVEPSERCELQAKGQLCAGETCLSCKNFREMNSHVLGTLLIPCRTAMRGRFPLNGTYFQVNEVFADHDSSHSPMCVPRDLLWNLRRRTVYFGTSIASIFRGLTTAEIQLCFYKGFVCVRGFDRKTRAPRPLVAQLHLPARRMTKGKNTEGKPDPAS